MKKINLLVVSLFALILASCSKDEEASFDINSLTITTIAPAIIENQLVINTGGSFSSPLPSNATVNYGICYGTSPNPTFVASTTEQGYNFTGSEYFNQIYIQQFGITIYIRAFVQDYNTGVIKYGNEVSVVLPVGTNTGIIRNISAESFSVDISVDNIMSSNEVRGICFSTSPNPTTNNSSLSNPTPGAGNYTLDVNLRNYFSSNYHNRTYYVRSFVIISGNVYYGNEVSFKSTGYIGGSGGIVFYDKGEFSNGWRYLEASQAKLNDPNSTNFKWSNSNNFIAGLNNEIGSGLENSTIIRNNGNNFNNIGATMALTTPVNNTSGWFLPSIEELIELYKIRKINLIPSAASGSNSFYNKNVMSSSQFSATLAFGINFDNGTVVNLGKNDQWFSCWQVRRF
jgi:hypothetical protein